MDVSVGTIIFKGMFVLGPAREKRWSGCANERLRSHLVQGEILLER